MNKREFVLGACALVGASGGAAADGKVQATRAGAGPVRAARPPELAPDLALAKWQHYLGDEFAVPGGHLRLTEVRAGSQPGAGGATSEQFMLLFTGAGAMTAGTQALRHGTGQQIALFLQPAGLTPQGQALYRADFNRLV